jgi:hypothetical protein
VDSTITIKGTEYTVGDDELILPDDEKGDTKIDPLGRLLGGEFSPLSPNQAECIHFQAANTNYKHSLPLPVGTLIVSTLSQSTPPVHVDIQTLWLFYDVVRH